MSRKQAFMTLSMEEYKKEAEPSIVTPCPQITTVYPSMEAKP
jgi:hypothetical protein